MIDKNPIKIQKKIKSKNLFIEIDKKHNLNEFQQKNLNRKGKNRSLIHSLTNKLLKYNFKTQQYLKHQESNF